MPYQPGWKYRPMIIMPAYGVDYPLIQNTITSMGVSLELTCSQGVVLEFKRGPL